MSLSPTQIRIAQDWIDQYVGKHCPCCGYTSLHLDNRLVALVDFPERGADIDASTAAPLLTLTCGVCANIRFFSAKLTGVITDRHAPATLKLPKGVATAEHA
jgi:hypothetical protein